MSPRVKRNWHLLKEMQVLIERGMAPNAAAVRVASVHWRAIVSPRSGDGFKSAVAWLKRNQRRYREDLRARALLERLRSPEAVEWRRRAAEQREWEAAGRLARMTPEQRREREENLERMRPVFERLEAVKNGISVPTALWNRTKEPCPDAASHAATDRGTDEHEYEEDVAPGR